MGFNMGSVSKGSLMDGSGGVLSEVEADVDEVRIEMGVEVLVGILLKVRGGNGTTIKCLM